MDGELIILGSGGSSGVPAIGNWWGNCDQNEPKNIRTRPSIAIKTKESLIIVDTGQDFRIQMNREYLGAPDAVIITHLHADHVNGIDDLRNLQRLQTTRSHFPLYAFTDVLDDMQHRFAPHLFRDSENGFYKALCKPVPVTPTQKILVAGVEITPFTQDHGTMDSLGLRVGNVAYSTDMKRLDDTAYEILRGVETWIVDAAGDDNRKNPVHACVDEVIEMNAHVGAKNVILTHLPPSMDYATLRRQLPPNFTPAYDGLKLPFSIPTHYIP